MYILSYISIFLKTYNKFLFVSLQYSLDYIPAVPPTNYANQPSPLSPPNIAIPPNTTGLILSPNKTPTMTLVPPKQYPPIVPAPPAVASINPTYHHNGKVALPPGPPAAVAPNTAQAPTPRSPNSNNVYNHYGTPTPQQTTVALATSPVVVNGAGVASAPINQPLLAIDTNINATTQQQQVVERTTNLKANVKITKISAKNTAVATATGPTAGVVPLVTNRCVELYTA